MTGRFTALFPLNLLRVVSDQPSDEAYASVMRRRQW